MKKFLLILSLVVTASTLSVLTPLQSMALSGSDFRAGNIMSDGVFFKGNSIDPSTIQAFLNSKVPTCDTNGGQAHSSGGTRATYGTSRGYPPPYTCLKDYSQSTPTKNAESGLCNHYNGGTKSAAQIIHDVGQTCGVSPKVLIVLLEKEQSLVTDSWPWSVQYRSATGYGCPDTAPCDTEYYGFFNQVYHAARQFKRYARDASSYGYRAFRDNYIQYNPNASCGGTNVYIENQATAGLYNYTPYQPNASALANLYGSGDGCGAYGNRNFWRIYNDWFGSTTADGDTDTLSLVRLNHGSGNVEVVGYPSIANYGYVSRYSLAGYPAVAPDGAVVPGFWPPNGDLSFIRLNHGSGKSELVSYSKSSNYAKAVNYSLTGYPAVGADGAVVTMFKPNGDLSFIRLNHGSGNVEVVTYSAGSNYKQMVQYSLTGYPAVGADGAVVPLFWPNGDLTFLRLNHGSGKVELISYSQSSNYKQLVNYSLTGYPAVAPDGAVVPLFTPVGNLSFIRLNHGSGKVEAVTYGANGNYKQLSNYALTGYPAVAPDGAVVPMYSR